FWACRPTAIALARATATLNFRIRETSRHEEPTGFRRNGRLLARSDPSTFTAATGGPFHVPRPPWAALATRLAACRLFRAIAALTRLFRPVIRSLPGPTVGGGLNPPRASGWCRPGVTSAAARHRGSG